MATKPGYGKAKGGEFERKVCKILSLWITEGKRDDIYWRSAMSGGRASVKFKKGESNKTQTGDICSIDPIGNKLTDRFIIECKSYRNIHLESLIYENNNKSTIYYFWNKLIEDGIKFKKHPLMIFKENSKQEMVFTDYNGFIALTDSSMKNYIVLSSTSDKSIFIMELSKFLQLNPNQLDLK